MTVFRRNGSDFWWIEFQYRGKRFRRSSETTSKRKAEEYERKWREELRATVLMGKIPETSWGAAIDRYLTSVVLPRGNASAAKRDSYVLAALKVAFGPDTLISMISAPAIAEYRDKLLSAGKAPATANRYLAVIKAILRRAHLEWGCLATVPQFKLLKLNNERYRWITEVEEELLLQHCPNHLRNLCVFLLDTGARLSEATMLTWNDVDLHRQPRAIVKFMETKTGKPRSVPLTKRSKEMLEALRDSAPENESRVFLYRNQRRPPYPSSATDNNATPFKDPHGAWYTATAKAQLKDLNLHDLRHTFASRLVSRGVPILTVSKLLGHSKIQMTMRYAHLAPSELDGAISALERGVLKRSS